MRTALLEPTPSPQPPVPDTAPATPADTPDLDTQQVEQALNLLDNATAQAHDLLRDNPALLPNAMLATTRQLLTVTALIADNLEGWVADLVPAAHHDLTQLLDNTRTAIRHTGAAQALVELSQPRDHR
ncbi:hypothetical protein AB0B31_10990 [Catellatospora citrea]|uniref:hypothetical protein n=1 Tax=Catellatospora citrea TaxID=53366 RepID=UPI0034071C28